MINSFHFLSTPGTEPRISQKTIMEADEASTLHKLLAEKSRKLISELKSAKITHPEDGNNIDWFIDTISEKAKYDQSCTLRKPGTEDFYYVDYRQGASLLLIKKNRNGTLSIRCYYKAGEISPIEQIPVFSEEKKAEKEMLINASR